MAAGSATEALEQMVLAPAPIMICDVIMPRHDGIWLLVQVRQRWPETAVIMASGAQELETVAKARRYGAVGYVPKPIGREMLHQALLRATAVSAPEQL